MSKIMKDVQGIVVGIGIVGVIMVLLTIILLQTKNITGVACSTSSFAYNSSSDLCYEIANTSNTVAVQSTATTVNNIITALQSPVTYFSLIVLVVVFAFLLGFLIKKLSNSGSKD